MTSWFARLKPAFKALFSILFARSGHDDTVTGAAAPRTQEATPLGVPSVPTATQLLAVLQRDGRLVDFLMEDLTPYADAQVGAAVRDVHAGCRRALQQYVSMAPVGDGNEGDIVMVDAGTDPGMVRVIGNITGQPPFRGTLRHRGWIVERLELPMIQATNRSVIAPAEIEVF